MTEPTLHLEREAVGKAAEVFPGFWLLASRHHPGGSKQFAEINNRTAIFRVEEGGAPLLLVVNATDPAGIPEVQRVEAETGLTVRYIVSPGGGHHLMMDPWHAAFAEAKVVLGPERIPRTRHGRKLMELPRVELMDLADPLPQFRGQVDFVLFHGLRGFQDEVSVLEGGADSMMSGLKIMWQVITGLKDPVDELWVHHAPSGVVIAGENLVWMMPAERLAQLSMMSRGMFSPTVKVNTMARKVADKAVVAACWSKVLAWDCAALMTFHDPPGFAFTGDCRGELEKAVKSAGQV